MIVDCLFCGVNSPDQGAFLFCGYAHCQRPPLCQFVGNRHNKGRSIFFISHVTFFFYLGFLSRTFTNHRTPGEGGGHFFNSSRPLPLASETLRH